jgi:hypothetical protein
MKVEGWLFLGCGLFFGGTDVVYWYTSHDPAPDHRARAQRRGRGAHALISGQLSRRPAEVSVMTPWFPAAFRPTASAYCASCSRRGRRLPSRSV